VIIRLNYTYGWYLVARGVALGGDSRGWIVYHHTLKLGSLLFCCGEWRLKWNGWCGMVILLNALLLAIPSILSTTTEALGDHLRVGDVKIGKEIILGGSERVVIASNLISKRFLINLVSILIVIIKLILHEHIACP
jgi:hypothetical protein